MVLPSSDVEQAERHGACLVVILGDRLGARLELEPNQSAMVIGRGTDADFQIASLSISRRHCRIVPHDGRYWIEDLQSTNHTFVNEKPIDKYQLRDGDRVRVGNSVLKFLAAGNIESSYLSEMHQNALRDELTGLYNRRYAMGLLSDEISRCRHEEKATLALAIIDVDRFKEINDRIGHLAGDTVLKQITEVLTKRVRSGDTLARIGGEEFAVIMPDTTLVGANEACERLRVAVDRHEFRLENGQPVAVTISIGLADWQDGMAELGDLMRTADRHLYEAKSTGRNRLRAPDPAT